MGNIGATLKRVIGNKNTVTLLAIIVCTVILYLFYNNRVNNAVRTTYTCYAVKTIQPRTKITEEMVSTVRILSSAVTTNMITTCDRVIGMYSSYATEIPQNSYFYESNVMKEEDMPDSPLANIPDGYTQFRLPVTFESTYGNAIFPGNKIDLFLKTENESDLLIYGKFIQGITVAGVKDKDGKNVFETTVEAREPELLLFDVPDDLYLLLMKAKYLGLEIVVVPRNSNYSASQGEVLVASEYLKKIVEDQTADIPDECILAVTGTAECRLADNTNNQNNNNQNNTTNDNTNNTNNVENAQ